MLTLLRALMTLRDGRGASIPPGQIGLPRRFPSPAGTAAQLLLVLLAGWMNRPQQDVIAYIQEENRVLKSKLNGKRIGITNDKARRSLPPGQSANVFSDDAGRGPRW